MTSIDTNNVRIEKEVEQGPNDDNARGFIMRNIYLGASGRAKLAPLVTPAGRQQHGVAGHERMPIDPSGHPGREAA
jgi:hypothetical protein